MEVRQLQHFLSIIEHGSLGRAAKHIHISEPALSKSIRRLEDELEVRLLDRGPKGMTATEFGQVFLRRARVILGELEASRREIKEMRGVGTVRVGFRPSFGSAILPEAVSNLQRARVNAVVVMREGLLNDLLMDLGRGDLDFVIATGIDDLDPKFEQQPLLRSKVVVLANDQHPISKMANPRPEDLASSSWVLPLQDDPIRGPLTRLLDSTGTSRLRVVAESNSVLTILSFVRDNQAVAFFPKLMAVRSEHMTGLRLLEIPGLVWNRSFHTVSRRGIRLTPAAQHLLDELSLISQQYSDH